MKIAIRGASGFIGSSLTKKIIKENNYEKLLLITRNKKNRRLNDLVKNKEGVNIAECDYLNPPQLKKIIENYDLIYDLSGLAFQIASKDAFTKQIIGNSLNALVLGSILERYQRLVWVSTSAVRLYLDYPDSSYTNSYAFSKYLGEEFLKKGSKGNIKILRISDVYGPGQDISRKMIDPQLPARRIQRFVAAYKLISRNKTSWIPSKGKRVNGFYKKGSKVVHEINNDFVYPTFIDDVVRVLINAGRTKNKKITYDLYGSKLSNLEMVGIIQNFFDVEVEIRIRNVKVNSIEKKESNFRNLGINPDSITTFSDGLRVWLVK